MSQILFVFFLNGKSEIGGLRVVGGGMYSVGPSLDQIDVFNLKSYVVITNREIGKQNLDNEIDTNLCIMSVEYLKEWRNI